MPKPNSLNKRPTEISDSSEELKHNNNVELDNFSTNFDKAVNAAAQNLGVVEQGYLTSLFSIMTKPNVAAKLFDTGHHILYSFPSLQGLLSFDLYLMQYN